jgi:ribosomal protein L7Ae-like RNA K-turn-binding protein
MNENQGNGERTRYDELAHRLKIARKRRQVTFGADKVIGLAKRNTAAIVWATNDLSRRAFNKLELVCRRYQIPLLRYGISVEIGKMTGEPSVKVYILTKSFSGVKHLIREFDDLFTSEP